MEDSRILRNLILGLLAYLAVVGLVALYMLSTGKIAGRGDLNDPARVALGEVVYKAHCAACHGARLEGQPDWETKRADGTYRPPPLDDSGHGWEHSDRQLYDYVLYGGATYSSANFKGTMPGFADALSGKEIWAILAFVKSRWSDETRERQSTASFVSGLHFH